MTFAISTTQIYFMYISIADYNIKIKNRLYMYHTPIQSTNLAAVALLEKVHFAHVRKLDRQNVEDGRKRNERQIDQMLTQRKYAKGQQRPVTSYVRPK